MRIHPMKGVSLAIAVGKWAKPHISVTTYTARVCLGFIAVTFYTLDLEEFMTYLADKGKQNNAKQ